MIGGEAEQQGIEDSGCPICTEPFETEDSFCGNCGYPLNGTEEQQISFKSKKKFNRGRLNELEKNIRRASYTMYFLSGLFFLSGIGLYFLYKRLEYPGAVLFVFLILSGIYGGLAYWCRLQPVPAILSGLILYVVTVIINVIGDPKAFFKSGVVTIFVLGFLIRGIRSAFEAERIKKQLTFD